MARQDVEYFQSFCRKWVNRAVNAHFRDVDNDNPETLSPSVPRQAIKRMCLHKDTDTMTLTIGKLLMWWVEARGLLDEFIYGIPSTDFEITHTYYPQVKLHFREDRYTAADNGRRPARGEVSFRWKEENYSTANITTLTNKIVADFITPVFFYQRGRQLWSYVDKSKGYYFQMTVSDETEAKKVIRQVIGVQEAGEPDWEQFLRFHEDKRNYATQETVRVMGETIRKPKKRPMATVKFAYAELFIPGVVKPIVLVDRTGSKVGALRYA